MGVAVGYSWRTPRRPLFLSPTPANGSAAGLPPLFLSPTPANGSAAGLPPSFYPPPPANGSAAGLRPSFPAAHAIPSQHHPSVGAVDGVAPVNEPGSRRCYERNSD